MTTLEKTGPHFKLWDEVRAFEDDATIITGKVVGLSDEGVDVLWNDLDEEIGYEFQNVTIIRDFIIEPHHINFFNLYESGRMSKEAGQVIDKITASTIALSEEKLREVIRRAILDSRMPTTNPAKWMEQIITNAIKALRDDN